MNPSATTCSALRKNGVTREEIAEIVTHAAFYCGWPKAWAVFRMAKGSGRRRMPNDFAGDLYAGKRYSHPQAGGLAHGSLTTTRRRRPSARRRSWATGSSIRLRPTATRRGVGEGIRTCGLKREELFVASKVAAEHKTYEDAARSIDETLEKMCLTYLDQMLIHSPQPWREFRAEKRYFQENRAVWRALEDAQAAGKVRVIGVSNFLRDDLENLLTGCRVRPAVNQLLLHCRYGPALAGLLHPAGHPGGGLFPHRPRRGPEKSGPSPPWRRNTAFPCRSCASAMSCSWGAVALPKTADPGHMRSNAAVDFAISRRTWRRCGHGAPDGLRRLQWISGVQRQSRWREGKK